MGTQQSTGTKSLHPSTLTIPSFGFRIINLQNYVNQKQYKLNIMTDYVIGQDPRLLNLKQIYSEGTQFVQFQVFSILDYKIRNVKIDIRPNLKQNESNNQINQKSKNQQKISNNQQTNHNQKQQKSVENQKYSKNQYSLGVSFKYYPKINDTILRISKVFKNSPLQKVNIKKDQYIVGLIEGQFQSMKQFVDLIKTLIQLQFQYVTLGICDSQGKTRLQKVSVYDLKQWNKSYGVGYLGVQLAEGWLNKWELKKHIQANRKKNQKNQQKQLKNSKIQQKKQEKSEMNTNYTMDQIKKEVQNHNQVDLVAHYHNNNNKIPPPPKFKSDHQIKQDKNTSKQLPKISQKKAVELQQKQKQITPTILQKSNEQKKLQENEQSNSEISSDQIQQKCNQMMNKNHLKPTKNQNIIKKSQNIIEINFKDDASTICMCKDYTKHCEKCFKEKENKYYFFNKKTNKIILIQKSMLFPRKN